MPMINESRCFISFSFILWVNLYNCLKQIDELDKIEECCVNQMHTLIDGKRKTSQIDQLPNNIFAHI